MVLHASSTTKSRTSTARKLDQKKRKWATYRGHRRRHLIWQEVTGRGQGFGGRGRTPGARRGYFGRAVSCNYERNEGHTSIPFRPPVENPGKLVRPSFWNCTAMDCCGGEKLGLAGTLLLSFFRLVPRIWSRSLKEVAHSVPSQLNSTNSSCQQQIRWKGGQLVDTWNVWISNMGIWGKGNKSLGRRCNTCIIVLLGFSPWSKTKCWDSREITVAMRVSKIANDRHSHLILLTSYPW